MTPIRDSFYARHWRWFVLGTLFLATFLNYLDRQTLSNAADPICKEFGLDNAQRGTLLATFIYAYAAAHLVVGPLVDRVRDFRRVFPLFVIGWSVCNLLVGFAHSHTAILWLRAALGFFEAANFPVCLLLIARIFPARERVLANGIFYSGAVIATLVAPKLVIYLASFHHWRWAFFITGGLGLVWLVPWLLVFRDPERRAPAWAESVSSFRGDESMAAVLRRPAFWGVVLIGIGIIPGLYFMTQWLPSYLTQAWSVPYNQMLGDRLVLVSLCQDLGMWLGGGAVLLLSRRGFSLLGARRLVVIAAYACMMSVLALTVAPSVAAALGFLCLYVFGLGAWLSIQQACKQDITVSRVATVVGFVGFAETIVSAFLVERVGAWTQKSGGFGAVFVLFGFLFTFALIIALTLMRERFLPRRAARPPA